jgi:hypothetical protein
MKQLETREQRLTRCIRMANILGDVARRSEYGDMLHLMAEPGDAADLPKTIDAIREGLNLQPEAVVHIDIQAIVDMLETGLTTHKLGLPEAHMDSQSIQENVFQIVYRPFGKGGWRIGTSAMVDSLIETIDRVKTDAELLATPMGKFLVALGDIDTAGRENSQRMFVLQYPVLDTVWPITKQSDADLATLDPISRERIESYLHIYALLSQVYPSRFSKDNPDKHVVVHCMDISWVWYLGVNQTYFNAYESINHPKIELPDAEVRDDEIHARRFKD